MRQRQVGSLTSGTNHAELDIEQAQAMGFDAFALNVGAPNADWAQSAVQQLFTVAQQKNFKLFFSLDFIQDGSYQDFQNLLQGYLGNSAYYRTGPNNYPVVSTFSAGALGPSDFQAFKQFYANELYFIPDFDGTQGYYTDTNGWFYAWDSVVDGVFSWETAWPAQMTTPTNVSTASDQYVQNGAKANGKTYMIRKNV